MVGEIFFFKNHAKIEVVGMVTDLFLFLRMDPYKIKASGQHLSYDFWRKVFLMLYSINWLHFIAAHWLHWAICVL